MDRKTISREQRKTWQQYSDFSRLRTNRIRSSVHHSPFLLTCSRFERHHSRKWLRKKMESGRKLFSLNRSFDQSRGLRPGDCLSETKLPRHSSQNARVVQLQVIIRVAAQDLNSSPAGSRRYEHV